MNPILVELISLQRRWILTEEFHEYQINYNNDFMKKQYAVCGTRIFNMGSYPDEEKFQWENDT